MKLVGEKNKIEYGKIDDIHFLSRSETWSFFRGDRVQILNGRDKGKQGIINMIIEERNWVFVEGMNWKYSRFGEEDEFPGIVMRQEMPLLVRQSTFHNYQ